MASFVALSSSRCSRAQHREKKTLNFLKKKDEKTKMMFFRQRFQRKYFKKADWHFTTKSNLGDIFWTSVGHSPLCCGLRPKNRVFGLLGALGLGCVWPFWQRRIAQLSKSCLHRLLAWSRKFFQTMLAPFCFNSLRKTKMEEAHTLTHAHTHLHTHILAHTLAQREWKLWVKTTDWGQSDSSVTLSHSHSLSLSLSLAFFP